MNQSMSGSTNIVSEMNHQSQTPAPPSPASKKETPAFVKSKKSSVIKIINPETKAEIIFATSDRTPSPIVKSTALKIASFPKQDDFPSTKYPADFASPDPAINAKFSPRGFHYDIDFPYQFKDIYKDKSSEDWDVIIKEIIDDLDARNQRSFNDPDRTVSTAGPNGPKTIQEIHDDVSPC